MGKPHKIQLSIPNPCKEDWHKMTPGEQGRFCSSCQKSVIDFSAYTDKELLDYFTEAKGKVCGKVSNHQLNRLIVANAPSDTPMFRRLLLGAAFTAGVAGVANGQQNMPAKDTNWKQKLTTAQDKIAADSVQKSVNTHYLKGQVVDDSTKVSLPFCEIVLETSTGRQLMGTMTDSNGNFQFPITEDLFHINLVMVFDYEGYKHIEENFILDKFPDEKTVQQYKLTATSDSDTTVGILIRINEPPLIPKNPDEHIIEKGDTPYW